MPLLCALAPCSCVVPPLKGGQRTSEAKLVFALETAPLLPLLCALALCSCAVPPLKRVQRTFVLETAPLLPLLCALALCSCVAPPLRGTNERWRPSQLLGVELFDGGQVSFFVRGRHKVHCLDSSFAFKIAVKGGQSRPREANRGQGVANRGQGVANRGQGVAKEDQLFGLDWPQF